MILFHIPSFSEMRTRIDGGHSEILSMRDAGEREVGDRRTGNVHEAHAKLGRLQERPAEPLL